MYFYCLTEAVSHSLCSQMQVSSALLDLRQRNTYPGNALLPWLKTPANSGTHSCLPGSSDSFSIPQDSGSSLIEIVKGSTLKAQGMVDAAIQVQKPVPFSMCLCHHATYLLFISFFFFPSLISIVCIWVWCRIWWITILWDICSEIGLSRTSIFFVLFYLFGCLCFNLSLWTWIRRQI